MLPFTHLIIFYADTLDINVNNKFITCAHTNPLRSLTVSSLPTFVQVIACWTPLLGLITIAYMTQPARGDGPHSQARIATVKFTLYNSKKVQ